ncbi:hypothetical protein FE549_23470 [Escherichia coli]|nr:hypothetical protein [Escherichia coli]EFD0642515.1 hypothetical protein [Escherichia coli]
MSGNGVNDNRCWGNPTALSMHCYFFVINPTKTVIKHKYIILLKQSFLFFSVAEKDNITMLFVAKSIV